MICGRFVVNHSFDHLASRTTWKQCEREHPKASFSDSKVLKSLVNQGKIGADLFGMRGSHVRVVSLRPKLALGSNFRSLFSLLPPTQFLSVERRLLTILSRYGIITAEKEFMRSRILDFPIASISHRDGLDHSFDHLQLRTTWKQCL